MEQEHETGNMRHETESNDIKDRKTKMYCRQSYNVDNI